MKINYERIKYSLLGKRIINRFKFSIIITAVLVPFALLFLLISLSISANWGAILLLPGLLIPLFLVYTAVKDSLFQARLLSDLTDREHDTLVSEHKKYEEKNIIRYGHLTSYGMVLDDGIIPWRAIDEIEILPGEYRMTYTRYGYRSEYYPPKIKVKGKIGKKLIVMNQSLNNEDYDLSDEIERFLDSIPKYTEYRFTVNNKYYYAK